MMGAHGWERAIVVSDSYHVFRARRIFSSMSINVALSPVPAANIESPLFYVFSMVREVVALHEQVLK
jgi:uncharacterized SAM-binding protein YcdF (DUF218 family)